MIQDLPPDGVACRSSSPDCWLFKLSADGRSRDDRSRSTNAVSTDPQVNAILEKSCYECHSTGGSAPWYAAVSPTYLAANSARGVLNFSDWQTYDAQKKVGCTEEHRSRPSMRGSMPPGDYTALDHSARLTDDEKQALLKWASQPALPAH